DLAGAWLGRGNVLYDRKRYDESFAAYDKVISIKPDFEGAWLGRGNVHNQLGRHDEALSAYDKALSIRPGLAEAWLGRGNVYNDLERHDEAFAAYDRALSISPDLAGAWLGRGNVFYGLERHEDALSAYDKALSIDPDLEGAWLGRGNVCNYLKRYDEAFAAFDRALAIKPDLEGAWLGRGNVFYDLRRYDEASVAYDKALMIDPDLEGAWLGRGKIYNDLHQYKEAFYAFDRTLSINPKSAEASLGRGNAYFEQNEYADALSCYEKALESKPDFPDAHWNLALLKLSRGEFEKGWKLYEYRWKTRSVTTPNRDFVQPLWLNDFSVNGKTLLIHAEQGLGDTIQFSRYIELLKVTGAKVVFEVQRPLVSLFKAQNWNYEIVAQGESLPPFDAHCPLMSLPLAFRTTLETVPIGRSYIDSTKIEIPDSIKISADDTRPKIGVAWSGNPNFAKGNDTRRPIPLDRIGTLMSDKFSWFRLQKDLRDSDKNAIASLTKLNDYSKEFKSFSDTAALLGQLDLVISIDTSIAHLAGAMGKPVWIMLPFHADFRWLQDRSDCPWYPTAKLYRQ